MSESAIRDYVQGMEQYIEQIKKDETPEESKRVLVRIGILEKNGQNVAKRYRKD